jgi:predicted nucleotidyltransferase
VDQKNRGDTSMAEADIKKIATSYAKEIKNKFDIVKIILFGSQVRGNPHSESDIDIAVVLKDFPNRLDMQIELMRIRRKYDSRIEPHPFRESEFDDTNNLVNEILRYGIPLLN